jgi:hypothetical protein
MLAVSTVAAHWRPLDACADNNEICNDSSLMTARGSRGRRRARAPPPAPGALARRSRIAGSRAGRGAVGAGGSRRSRTHKREIGIDQQAQVSCKVPVSVPTCTEPLALALHHGGGRSTTPTFTPTAPVRLSRIGSTKKSAPWQLHLSVFGALCSWTFPAARSF